MSSIKDCATTDELSEILKTIPRTGKSTTRLVRELIKHNKLTLLKPDELQDLNFSFRNFLIDFRYFYRYIHKYNDLALFTDFMQKINCMHPEQKPVFLLGLMAYLCKHNNFDLCSKVEKYLVDKYIKYRRNYFYDNFYISCIGENKVPVLYNYSLYIALLYKIYTKHIPNESKIEKNINCDDPDNEVESFTRTFELIHRKEWNTLFTIDKRDYSNDISVVFRSILLYSLVFNDCSVIDKFLNSGINFEFSMLEEMVVVGYDHYMSTLFTSNHRKLLGELAKKVLQSPLNLERVYRYNHILNSINVKNRLLLTIRNMLSDYISRIGKGNECDSYSSTLDYTKWDYIIDKDWDIDDDEDDDAKIRYAITKWDYIAGDSE